MRIGVGAQAPALLAGGPRALSPYEVLLVPHSGSHGPYLGEGTKSSRGSPWCPRNCWEPSTQTPASGAPAPQTWALKNIIHRVIPESVYKTVPRQAHEIGQSTLKSIPQGWFKKKKKPQTKNKTLLDLRL